MNSRLLIGTSLLLMAGAVVLAVLAVPGGEDDVEIVDDTTPDADRPVEVSDTARDLSVEYEYVLHFVDDMERGARIGTDDVALQRIDQRPPGTLESVDEAVGRRTLRTLPAGTLVTEDSLADAALTLGARIADDERALAISVDDVIGVGGFVRPGDSVDVLLYVDDGRGAENPRTTVVVPAARVLAYGEALDVDPGNAEPLDGRTAVLAVPDERAGHLLLASEVGSLRLAVRGDSGEGREMASADDMAWLGDIVAPAPENQEESDPAQPPAVEVFRGTVRSREHVGGEAR